MQANIVGIQQIGIGVPDVKAGFKWYNTHLGMDIPVFEEAAEANLMLPYTGGKPHKRHAILAINMKGGGGFEIWQYTSRTPQKATFEIQLGDLGINYAHIKTDNIQAAFSFLKSKENVFIGEITALPNGESVFYLRDLFGNLFKIIEKKDFFGKGLKPTGGPCGCTIGVSDIEKSIPFYRDILGYDTIVYKTEGSFSDLNLASNSNNTFKRVLLRHSKPRTGSFSKLLGESEIELIQVLNRTPKKIFENRFWGDLGFIHLCFDITGMEELKSKCSNAGFPFTVDSANSFDMGEAAGRFSYIEDPDGTLIEFVETHKIPILKKLGWYLNLKTRDAHKALPSWMLKAMALNRVKY